MRENKKWKEYFAFSRKERNAVIILLALMFILLVLPNFFKSSKAEIPVINLSLQKQFDSVIEKNNSYSKENYSSENNNDGNSSNSYASSNEIKLNLFPFDPNTLSEDGFQKLGLPQRNINTILHYRDKGGKFRKPGDIKKVYGLNEQLADKLVPYIKIAGSSEQPSYSKTDYKQYENNAPFLKEKYHTISINTATEEEWKSLPGIGDVLSKRIVKFRNSMGGFKSVDDVARTYGLPDSTFKNMRPYLLMKE